MSAKIIQLTENLGMHHAKNGKNKKFLAKDTSTIMTNHLSEYLGRGYADCASIPDSIAKKTVHFFG